MSHNGEPGGFVCTDKQEYAAYERLPREVRNALANANYSLSAAALARKRWPKAKMLAAIEAQNNNTYDEWKAANA